MRKLILSLLISFTVITVSAQKLSVYFPYYRSTQQVDAIQYDKVTDVIYAFAKPTQTGGTEILGPAIFNALRLKCVENSVPFELSIGGWGLSDNFSTIAANATLRNTFAQHCANLCTQYGLAGIDIDWEFPSPSEVDNVNLLLEAIQTALSGISTPQNKITLSVAVGGDQGHANYFKAGFSDFVDYVNIMAYDAPVGTWGNHASMEFMQSAIELWVGMGVPKSKMLVGVPFYGRCAGEASYADISAPNPSAAFVTDTYNGYCYNGKPTLIAKTDTAMTIGCAGIMVWEVSHDRSDQYSLLSVIDSTLEKYECAVPDLEMETVYTNCFSDKTLFVSNVSAAAGRTFSWAADGVLLYAGSENSFETNILGQFVLTVEEDGCTKTINFEVNRTIDLSSIPSSIVLCNPGIDSIESPYKLQDGFKTIWEFNSEVINSNVDAQEVLQVGDYTLTVSAPWCPSVDKVVQVTSSGIVVENKSACENEIGHFYAENADKDLVWYYAQHDEQSFFEGDTLVYVMSVSDTLFYEEKNDLVTHIFTESESGFNQNSSFYGTKFTISNGAHLSSLEFTTIAAGTVGISVIDDSFNDVHSTSINATSGQNTMAVDWDFGPGTYFITCTEAPAGQLKLYSTYTANNVTKGDVTLHSGVYNSFAAPQYNDKSEYFGFFREITFESGEAADCGRKAVVITANECNTCVSGNFSLNNILLTYGDPAVKVNPNYQGVNDLYFYSNGGVVSFTNDFAKPLKVGSTSYFVAEICNGDTIQTVSAQILVQKAILVVKAINDTIEINEALPTSIGIQYSGFKNGDTENVLQDLPIFTQSTDGSSVGEFVYNNAQNAKADNYNISYNTGRLVVLDATSIDKESAEGNRILHTVTGKKLKMIKQGLVLAYSVNGKRLWMKNFEVGLHAISPKVFVLMMANGTILK